MFKVLILQAMYALSDERTEFLIKDRLSFMRFLVTLPLGTPSFITRLRSGYGPWRTGLRTRQA